MPREYNFANGSHMTWYGGEIANRATAALVPIVRNVTRAAAEYARRNHPWKNRTGDLELGIFAAEPKIEGDVVRGLWGAPSPALYLEMGTVKMPPYPFLRPAADATYRLANFAAELRLGLSGGSPGGIAHA